MDLAKRGEDYLLNFLKGRGTFMEGEGSAISNLMGGVGERGGGRIFQKMRFPH